MRKTLLLFLFLSASLFAKAQTTFFNTDTVQNIEIFFSQPDWNHQMDTAYYGAGTFIMADSVLVNGHSYDSVGVKYKGRSSFDTTYLKNPLHIALNEYKSHSYQGVKNIKLSSGYSDPSMIREVLSYKILGNYMDCGRANFCQVYINGMYSGVYTNCEDVSSPLLNSHFNGNNGTFIKCNPNIAAGPTTKCNLKYVPGGDSTAYFTNYQVKSTYGWNELKDLCDTVTNYPSYLSSVTDVDRWLWMLSFDNILVNLDSYEGAFCQNYYLYKDGTHRFNPIVWDMNMSFGGLPYAGAGYTSLAPLTLTNMQQLPLTLHSVDVYWPMIKNVFSNPMYKRMYIAHARTVCNENFNSGNYITDATHLQTVIDTAIQTDVNLFYSYTAFQNGMTANVTSGSTVIPGISNLMDARVTYLNATTEFGYVPPVITNVTPSAAMPALYSTVTITAKVSNNDTSGVYLGYRNGVYQKFTRVRMYDDGLHNDGTANDSVYGGSFAMTSAQGQYYIYAENANAGMFSPERAEHEFYSLSANEVAHIPGQVFINEFMANNISGAVNENGVHADWIEFYNNTSSDLSLAGLYLTDDISIPNKFTIPDVGLIPAHGFQIIWADDSVSSPTYVHANFNLNALGEHIMLSTNIGIVMDSISFGSQLADVSMARCPDGTGVFMPQLPTFNVSNNCSAGINENNLSDGISIYPNPTTGQFQISNFRIGIEDVKIYNVLGECIYQSAINNQQATINISQFSNGIYFVETKTAKGIFVRKLVKL